MIVRECTGMVERWCPIHGNCVCPDNGGTPDCPLRGVRAMGRGGHLGPLDGEVTG